MSRVLARSMFKKNAPKRSAKGVGITSMLEDDVAGYAEGGEVTDDRTERERLARQLLERNRDEGEMYQRFSEQERPRQYRPPATAGMVMPQPNPQQVQAAQMQQMAQMGMLPRFQEGGEVQAAVEVPSMWSKITDRLGAPFRERTGPILDPNTGEPAVFFDPNNPIDRTMGGIGDMAATLLTRGRMRSMPRPQAGGGVEPSRPGPWEMDRTTGPWSAPQPLPRRASPPPESPVGPTGPSIPGGPSTSVPSAGTRPSGAELRFPRGISERTGSAIPEQVEIPEPTYREDEGSPAGDYGGEGGGIMGGRMKESAKKAPATPPEVRRPAGPPKATDLGDIKSEREAKAAAARQENIWLALMQAGLAIAGGKSSNAVANIGQGGQAGLASFMALEQQRRRDEDAAMRRGIAEREVNLQERRLSMQQPLLEAQAEYYRSRPLAAENMQRMRMAVARQKAEENAGKSWNDMVKSNPKYMTMSAPVLQAQRQLYITQEANRIFPIEYQKILVGLPGTGTATAPSDEE